MTVQGRNFWATCRTVYPENPRVFPICLSNPTPITFQRPITATDQAIDNLVYELYDLTDEEITIVEAGAT